MRSDSEYLPLFLNRAHNRSLQRTRLSAGLSECAHKPGRMHERMALEGSPRLTFDTRFPRFLGCHLAGDRDGAFGAGEPVAGLTGDTGERARGAGV